MNPPNASNPNNGAPNNAGAQRQLRIEVPQNLSAVYANVVIVSHTGSEVIMDFTQVLPNDPRARVQSRIVMTPTNAKLFLRALETNLERFEEKHGEIVLPPQPATLADQLFGGVKPTGDSPADEAGGGS
ncbi:MAG: DUF3467 domain-containing protein [Anaerolineae bacterium]|nr:DUF3467 domain-containing protein [Anaerolineae bacterium]